MSSTPPEFDADAPLMPASVPWRGRDAILLALLEVSLTIGIVLLIDKIFSGELQVAVEIAVTEVVLAASVVWWVRLRYDAPPRALGLERPTRTLVMRGIGAGLVGMAVAHLVVGPLTVLVAEWISDESVSVPAQIEYTSPAIGVVVLTGIAVIFLAPLAEEMFFRGFLFRGLRKGLPLWAAVTISSVAFGLVHGQPLIIPSITALGVVLALEVERTRSIVPAIVGHALFNVSGFLFLLFDSWT